MRKGSLYALMAGFISLLSACAVQMQTYNLNEDYATTMHYEGSESDSKKDGEETVSEDDLLVGIPARTFYSGDLKRGGIWWAGKGITLEKGDVFLFEVSQIGPDSTPLGATNPAIDLPTNPFGATFPPLDMIKEKVALKLVARAEAHDTVRTFLHLQLDDASGYQANAKRPAHQIHNSPDFKEYYFSLQDIFTQVEPTKHKVNGAMINNLKFLINPGQTGYTGKIYIQEIRIVPAPQN